MPLKISHSQVYQYSTCSLKYKYHYVDRLRPKVISGALLFGSAMDKALGTLLTTKDLKAAKDQFAKLWSAQQINNDLTVLPFTTKVVYSKKDYDSDLIFPADETKFLDVKKKYNIDSDKTLKQLTAFYRELKREKGHDGLTEEQKIIYNYGHWICLLNKGLIMLDGYNQHILPRIKKVYAQQKKISIKNDEGDEITGYIDLIAEMDDGKIYILDHKTSAMEYEKDAAETDQQLIVYYYNEKEDYNLGGVGFIVLYKQLDKNKKKICSACQFDGSGGRHKTCANEIFTAESNFVEKDRCGGEWNETIAPEARFDVILNEVTERAENLVIDTFSLAAQGIKNQVFIPNLQSCGGFGADYRCTFFNKCWKGKDDDLMVLPEKKR
jgi:hypothetical protein